MPKRVRLLRLPLVLVWLLAVVGCTPPGEKAVAEPAGAAEMLGDLRTVDPCTLTDPAALAHVGAARPAATVSLDYCLLHVELPDGSLAQLSVGELERVPPGPPSGPVRQLGTLRVRHDAPIPGHCARPLLFGDGIAMNVSADLLSGDPGAGLCGVAQAGAEIAAEVVQRGEVGHHRFPADSLALIDPCAVLDTAVVAQMPGLADAEPVSAPARHQCRWGELAADAPRIQYSHTAGAPPTVLHGAAVEEMIAGRRTVLSVVGGDPSVPLCSAETAHRPFGDPASGQVEVAMLVVAVPGETGIDACEYARGLAAATWPRLPAA
ncbi:hypothetical protein [Saccharopolyspora cebuensis]|uniref:DUF3558 domain-containing protein n=1 Tax=Saccharopolyspora cebuensis TaxID=418759 RepID=A0ABV4CED8_9PSEU